MHSRFFFTLIMLICCPSYGGKGAALTKKSVDEIAHLRVLEEWFRGLDRSAYPTQKDIYDSRLEWRRNDQGTNYLAGIVSAFEQQKTRDVTTEISPGDFAEDQDPAGDNDVGLAGQLRSWIGLPGK